MPLLFLAALTVALSDPLARFSPEGPSSFHETDVPANGIVEADVVVDGLEPKVPVTLSNLRGGRWYRLLESKRGVWDAMEKVKGDKVVPAGPSAVFRWQRPASSFGRPGAFDVTLCVIQSGVTNALPLHVTVHPVHLPEAQRASFRFATGVRYGEIAAAAGLEPWSKAYCDRLGSYLHLAVRGRQNVVIAPEGEVADAFRRVCEDCLIDWCRTANEEELNPGRLPWLRRWLPRPDGSPVPPGGNPLVCEGKDGPLPTIRLEAVRQALEDYEMLAEVRRKDPARAQALEERLTALHTAARLDAVRYRALRRELLQAAVKSDFPRTRLATERHPVPAHVAADGLGVWTADSMRAVSPGVFPTRAELARPEIALQLVRNERESAQVCLTAGAGREWRGVTLAVSQLCDAKGRPLGGSVKWERIGYVPRRPGYFPNPCGPDPVEKWVPDPLLPAAPMRVRAGSTQGAWLTVFASPEAEPGVYTGRVDVVADGRTLGTVPLRAEVSSVALPKTFSTWNSFSVMDGYTRIQYPERTKGKIRESWDILLDHRLSPDDISRFRPADVDDLVYARGRGMNLFNVMNIVPVPDDPNTPIVYNAPTNVLFSKTFYPSFRDRIAPYVAELKRRGLGDILYFYGFDEQEKEVYPAIAGIRRNLAADFPGIPIMSTARAYRDMAKNPTNPPPDAAACDWFCPLTGDWNERLSAELQAKGRKVWWYTCCGPDYPFANFGSHEHPPVEARVLLGWMTGLYRADGFLFWLVNRWNRSVRPLDETDTYLDVDTSISNRRDGDAFFLYPGREHVLPSIRLANVRDGVEDGEVLKLLENRDLVRADALRRTLVRSLRDFSRDPSELRAARAEAVRALSAEVMLDLADAAPVGTPGALDELLPRPRRLARRPGRVPAAELAPEGVRAGRGKVPGVPDDRREEAYRLTADASGVRILAGGRLGELHARATLRQLTRLADGAAVPAFELTDWPELPLRGLMLDTGRNFVELAAIRDVIDHLALYKMNVFHWHLTDRNGWRLESKRYPELNGDRATTRFRGKFYTQDEFRALVDYAWERGVTVVPEFDVPGHTQAFRQGIGVEKMREKKVRGIVLDLIDELCALVPADRMPYVHLGTDEVDQDLKGGIEWVPKEWIAAWAERVASHGRTLIGWQPGEKIEMRGAQLKEIWGWVDYHADDPEWTADFGTAPYVDSTEFCYINHIDPFELLNAAAFQKPCPWGPRENRRGVMISAWHDDAIAESEDYFRQVMVFPAITMYADAFWCGRERRETRYFGRLPQPGTADFAFAADLERRTLAQRDRVLKDLRHPFPYVAQTHLRWRLSTGDGRLVAADIPQGTVYPNRTLFGNPYVDEQEGKVVLETWIRSPVAQELSCWIGTTAFARSGGRFVDGPVPQRGEWNRHGATVELNGVRVRAPDWAHPGLGGQESRETPAVDEEYFYRVPTRLSFRAGWNHVKLTLPKGPQTDPGQKWVGTFVPISGTSEHPREVAGLEFSSSPK